MFVWNVNPTCRIMKKFLLMEVYIIRSLISVD